MKTSRSQYLDLRGLRHHVRTWGAPEAPKLFLLHGWMDVSASFQFLVDALSDQWHILAPDLRGFGLTAWSGAQSYWFPDYLADVEALLNHFQPEVPVRLLGHSMGGNVACLYAGIRPHRVAQLVNLEGLGVMERSASDTPARFGRWLDELNTTVGFREYDSFEALARRLGQDNPRLTPERASFLAAHWAVRTPAGKVVLRSDPAHKRVNPIPYRVEEMIACWQRIEAQVLWVEGDSSDAARRHELSEAEVRRRREAVPALRFERIANAGHMLHLDQPEALARVLEDFLR